MTNDFKYKRITILSKGNSVLRNILNTWFILYSLIYFHLYFYFQSFLFTYFIYLFIFNLLFIFYFVSYIRLIDVSRENETLGTKVRALEHSISELADR